MSKLRIGNYDTGEPKFMYFKRHKHYAQNVSPIRWKIYVAWQIKWDSSPTIKNLNSGRGIFIHKCRSKQC